MRPCRISGSYIVMPDEWRKLSNASCLASLGYDGLSQEEVILSHLHGYTNCLAESKFPEDTERSGFKYKKIGIFTLIEINIFVDIEKICLTDIKKMLYSLSDDIIMKFMSPNQDNSAIDCEVYFPRTENHRYYIKNKKCGWYILKDPFNSTELIRMKI